MSEPLPPSSSRPPTLRSLRTGLIDNPSRDAVPPVAPSDQVVEKQTEVEPETGPAETGPTEAVTAETGTAETGTAETDQSEPDHTDTDGSEKGPDPILDPAQTITGVAKSATAFVAGLNRTISQAATSQRTVLVFRLRGIAKGLLTWNDNPPIDAELARVCVEQHLLATEPHLALLALPDGELLGFDTELKQDRREADQLGGRLLGALAKPMGERGREFVVSVRLGAAIFDPGDGSADQLTQADQAMQAAGRALQQTSFATPFLVHNSYIANRSARLEETGELLPKAMAGNQIMVEYQPRVGAQDRLINGIEVLPRWYHRDRGTIPPREFLRAAESTGRLIELGQSIRREAVAAAHEWQLTGRLQNCRVWMNLAPVELCHPGLTEEVAGLVAGHPSLHLGFEVSDSALLEDLAFLRLFDRLQEYGVQLAVDNVNYSRLSFGRLRRLPVSSINLDGELVRNLPSSAANRDLVRLICAMAAEREQTVTACGIETSEQLEVAAVLGVDRLQGFGISKVLSHASMEQYLEKYLDSTKGPSSS